MEWIEPIPDNPDLALILPFVEPLRNRARYLKEKRVLRLPFVHDPLASAVKQSPPPADGSHGEIELAELEGEWFPQPPRLGLAAGTRSPGRLRCDRSREPLWRLQTDHSPRNGRRAAGSARWEARPTRLPRWLCANRKHRQPSAGRSQRQRLDDRSSGAKSMAARFVAPRPSAAVVGGVDPTGSDWRVLFCLDRGPRPSATTVR